MGRRSRLPATVNEVKCPSKLNTLIEVGAEFDSFDSLDMAIRTYEAENLVNLIARDTRTVEAAEKRNRRKNYNPAIKYSDVCYCCTYGGKKFKSRSTGKRNYKTTKQACPFNLKVRATVDGQRLFIREMCATHNHDVNEAEFRLHPKQRKLDHVSQEEIATLLTLEPDKKLLREKLMQVTGKAILMKDIHNIKTRLVGGGVDESASVKTKGQRQFVEEICDDNLITASVTLGEVATTDEERDVSSQLTVIELVDDLTGRTSDGRLKLVQHSNVDLQDGKGEDDEEGLLSSSPLSLQIPISQIGPGELSSVLNTIVINSTSVEDETMHAGIVSSHCGHRLSPQTVTVDPAIIIAAAAGSTEDFSHTSTNHIFPCSLESFSTHEPHHEIYHITTHQQSLLPPDVASIVVDPSLPPVNAGESSPGGEPTSHQSFNHSLEEDVTSIGMNILHALQPWQDLDSSPHNSERTSFQMTATSNATEILPISHGGCSFLNPLSSILSSDNVSKFTSPGENSVTSPGNCPIDASQHLHQQQQQRQQSIGERKRTRSGRISSHPSKAKARRNPIEADREALKKKYFQQASVNLFFNERFSFHGDRQARDRWLNQRAHTMSEAKASEFHDMLKPLSWLFGSWEGQDGKCIYPTMADFNYSEMAEFYPVGAKPMVEYRFFSTTPDGRTPLHRETGYIRIKPNSNHIAFVASHNLGIAEVQEGEVTDNELTVETTELARVSFNKPPVVKKVRRTIRRTGNQLEHIMDMKTDKTEMTEHLRITFRKSEGE